jgi:hypothetical protein
MKWRAGDLKNQTPALGKCKVTLDKVPSKYNECFEPGVITVSSQDISRD